MYVYYILIYTFDIFLFPDMKATVWNGFQKFMSLKSIGRQTSQSHL